MNVSLYFRLSSVISVNGKVLARWDTANEKPLQAPSPLRKFLVPLDTSGGNGSRQCPRRAYPRRQRTTANNSWVSLVGKCPDKAERSPYPFD